MREVQRRARGLASMDEPAILSGLVEFLEGGDGVAAEFFSGVDKASTVAERVYSQADLSRNMEHTRPQTLVVQRDSGANRHVESSRASALSQFSLLSLHAGSNLTQQFESEYFPRVFCTTLP